MNAFSGLDLFFYLIVLQLGGGEYREYPTTSLKNKNYKETINPFQLFRSMDRTVAVN